MNCMRKHLILSAYLGLALSAKQSNAMNLNDAVQSAIAHNPEVLQRLHEFRGSEQEIAIGQAEFLPTVDLSYQSNQQKFDYPPASGVLSQHYTTRGWTMNVTQNLFRGLQSFNQVRQLSANRQARYFSFLDTSESIALQTLQAYQNVLLYRQLVLIAKDNYAIHKGILSQISQRVQAGVGRRVDLEQAAGRLALAETNLITDNTNLQEVSARFLRLTSNAPSDDMANAPRLDDALPTEEALMQNAVHHSPSYLGAIATLHSAQSELNVQRGAFSPTINLQLSQSPTDNYNGYTGQTKLSSTAVTFSLNLFRGGADRGRLGAAAEKRNASIDQREQACRSLRQDLSLAWDNMRKFKAQMASLLQHQLSTEKARNAYRKQFDIGQRTLLDVLDSENELFNAQRSYLAAQTEYVTAQATVLSHSGMLLAALKLKPLDEEIPGHMATEEEISTCNSVFSPLPMLDVQSIPARQLNAPPLDEALDDKAPQTTPPPSGKPRVIIERAK